MNNFGQQLMQAIDRKISGPPKDAAAETIKAALAGRSVCSPEDKKRIQELDKQYGQAYETVLASDYQHAKQAFAAEQRRQELLISQGQFDGSDFWSLQDFAQDFQQRQAAGKRQMFLIGVAAATISKPICARVSSILNEQADAIDLADQEKYEHFAVPFSPGPLSARLRQLAASVMARVTSGGGSRPAQYCGFLIND